jgi:hypothetical protein
VQRQRDHGDQRTHHDEGDHSLHRRRRSGAACPQCDDPITESRRQRRFDPGKTIGTCHEEKTRRCPLPCRDGDIGLRRRIEVYIVVTYFGLGGAAQEASIWPNKKGPYGDAEELMLHQLGRPPEARPNPYRWKNGKLYYRGKPCANAKPPKDK